MAQPHPIQPIAVCLALTRAISRAETLDDIYHAALDALAQGLGVSRASILLFDTDRVMRFKASRGLSDTYRKAVEGHTPWTPDTRDPQPIVVADVTREKSLQPFLQTIVNEGIAAMAFIPLVSVGHVIGKFMIYSDTPRELTVDELQLAGVIAAQVAFAVTRVRTEDAARRAEEQSRRSEERLRFALEASSVGTWEWHLSSQSVQWSANLEQLHGLPPGTFDGTFDSYVREIHPDDRERVLASQRRAIAEGSPYDVEYRIVAPDGTVRWVEGKGRVELENGTPVRMTGVCIVVTRRKEAELARLVAAEEANRSKDEFLGTLSHELRTPLNAIVGWVQMLQQGDMVSPDRVAHAIEVIGRNARLQTQLIEDILDITRIVAGKLDIERRPLLLSQLLDTVLTGFLPAAEAKRVKLSREIPNDLPPIEGDAKRLHQVLSNILANAIKFTPDGGQVRISCRVDRDAIVIDVQDSGAGIAPDFLPFVFERFRQADKRSARQHGGLGLGLAIARHLVEQHGGEIHAHSDGPGSGSTFSVRLPVAAGPGTHIASRELRSVAHIRLDRVKALVVEDDPDSRELLVAWLGRCGADICACDSTASAIAALDSAAVNLIVADLGMPGIDGFGLIEHVRQMGDGYSRVPAVAVSAFARPEDRDRALQAGYDGYCPKPVDIPDFLRTVDVVLKRTESSAADRPRH
jgi:PAS domain S-box-containing protein